MLDGSNVNFLIAFIAGTISFLAPCVLSVLPVQASYVASVSFQEHQPDVFYRRHAFINSLFFILGFLLIFTVLGITVNTFARYLLDYKDIVLKVGGLLMVILGLHLIGVFHHPFFYKTLKVDISKNLKRGEKFSAFILGLTFAFAWTPCIGPVLAVILFWAGNSETFLNGFTLLLAYGLGMAVPFLLLSVFIDYLGRYLIKFKKLGYFLNIAIGIVIVFIGFLLVFDKLGFLIRYTLILGSSI